jgi:hypothetical protein
MLENETDNAGVPGGSGGYGQVMGNECRTARAVTSIARVLSWLDA